jgi:hypothetical protein
VRSSAPAQGMAEGCFEGRLRRRDSSFNQPVVLTARPGSLTHRSAHCAKAHRHVEASSTDKDHSRGNRRTRQKRETGSGTQDNSAQEQRRLRRQNQVKGPSAGAAPAPAQGMAEGCFEGRLRRRDSSFNQPVVLTARPGALTNRPAHCAKAHRHVRRTMGDLARRSPAPRRSAGQRRPRSAKN